MTRATPSTERVHRRTANLDVLPTVDLVAVLVREQGAAVRAAARSVADIAEAVEIVVERLQRGGRLHYVGAGSSGRIAVVDAAECPPTFGVDPTLVQAHIAGGADALLRAVEGAEDDASAGEQDTRAVIGDDDVLVAVSASGGAPYVIAAATAARAAGAFTIALVNAGDSPLEGVCHRTILLNTGAEPVAGSTRMKAGTAQKIVLNALSTAVMVRLGKVHENLMVDLVATNEKLRRRAVALVRRLAGGDDARALALLSSAGGNVKRAVVMARLGVDARAATERLARSGGRLRAALGDG